MVEMAAPDISLFANVKKKNSNLTLIKYKKI